MQMYRVVPITKRELLQMMNQIPWSWTYFSLYRLSVYILIISYNSRTRSRCVDTTNLYPTTAG